MGALSALLLLPRRLQTCQKRSRRRRRPTASADATAPPTPLASRSCAVGTPARAVGSAPAPRRPPPPRPPWRQRASAEATAPPIPLASRSYAVGTPARAVGSAPALRRPPPPRPPRRQRAPRHPPRLLRVLRRLPPSLRLLRRLPLHLHLLCLPRAFLHRASPHPTSQPRCASHSVRATRTPGMTSAPGGVATAAPSACPRPSRRWCCPPHRRLRRHHRHRPQRCASHSVRARRAPGMTSAPGGVATAAPSACPHCPFCRSLHPHHRRHHRRHRRHHPHRRHRIHRRQHLHYRCRTFLPHCPLCRRLHPHRCSHRRQPLAWRSAPTRPNLGRICARGRAAALAPNASHSPHRYLPPLRSRCNHQRRHCPRAAATPSRREPPSTARTTPTSLTTLSRCRAASSSVSSFRPACSSRCGMAAGVASRHLARSCATLAIRPKSL